MNLLSLCLLRLPAHAALALGGFTFANAAAGASVADFPTAAVTQIEDRDQMMAQLGISYPSLPSKLQDPNRPPSARPADAANPEGNWTDDAGNIYARSGFGLWTNYDDTKAGFFPGPEAWRVGDYAPLNVLRGDDGAPVGTAAQWWERRRPEILDTIRREVWGTIPDKTPPVVFTARVNRGGEGAGAYVQQNLLGKVDTSGYPAVRQAPVITAYLRLPAAAPGPVPVIIVITPTVYPGVASAEAVLNRYWERVRPAGWGVCIFNPATLQPDDGAGLTSYLIGLCNRGAWRKPADWGALAAWSWGVSRLIDHFETEPAVNAAKVGVAGHSRFGKAALVAMAYEPRLAVAFSSCAGSLGPKLNRRHWGQDLETSGWEREYHWVAGNVFKYMGPINPGSYLPRKVELLPVDAQHLIALCAPRPVFVTGGTQDSWSDPFGEYLALREATPAYELLGGRGLVMPDAKPRVDVAYIDGALGYRYHAGGHTDAPDWPAFLEFAKRFLD